jgi:hypothetical protein
VVGEGLFQKDGMCLRQTVRKKRTSVNTTLDTTGASTKQKTEKMVAASVNRGALSVLLRLPVTPAFRVLCE